MSILGSMSKRTIINCAIITGVPVTWALVAIGTALSGLAAMLIVLIYAALILLLRCKYCRSSLLLHWGFVVVPWVFKRCPSCNRADPLE